METGPAPARKTTSDEAISPPESSNVDAGCSSIPVGNGHTGGEAALYRRCELTGIGKGAGSFKKSEGLIVFRSAMPISALWNGML